MIRIVADDKIPFLRGVLDDVAEIKYFPGNEISEKVVKDVDALIIRTRTQCNKELLHNSKVKCIATATIGYDHIDTNYCEKNGIQWFNAPGCNSSSVRQYISSALSEILRKTGKRLKETTLGIIGVGNVGSKVENMAKLLGMQVLNNDPPRQEKERFGDFVSLDNLLKNSDIVTIHVPLNKNGKYNTWHMVDETFIRAMKRNAWLINSSRGEVVKTHDLKEALQYKFLGGAILDVWENEPEADRDLIKLAYLTTPHIAGYSIDGKANGTAMSVRKISQFFNLGFDSWYPEDLPKPVKPAIEINCADLNIEKLFIELSTQAYDIKSDSANMKSRPEAFENIRGYYPVRREPPAITVQLKGCKQFDYSLIQALGYKPEVL